LRRGLGGHLLQVAAVARVSHSWDFQLVRAVTAPDGAGCSPGIIDDAEARAILEDAAAAHRAAVPLSDGAASYHEEPAATIELILEGGNSMRRARSVPATGGDEPAPRSS
jgi:hypothetical protein